MSRVLKRSIVINGHKTSISLETEFWMEFKRIASEKKVTVAALGSKIDSERSEETNNLCSAIRLFVLDDVKSRMRRAA